MKILLFGTLVTIEGQNTTVGISYKNLMSWSRNGRIAWERRLFTTGQTLILSIVMIQLGFGGTHGGHVPCGVTAHGSPGGPLQFDRLEAALAAKFY